MGTYKKPIRGSEEFQRIRGSNQFLAKGWKTVDNLWKSSPAVDGSGLGSVVFLVRQGGQGQVAFEEGIVLRQEGFPFVQGQLRNVLRRLFFSVASSSVSGASGAYSDGKETFR